MKEFHLPASFHGHSAVLAPPKPRAILFDWDHTLINPDAAVKAAVAETIEEMAALGHVLPADGPYAGLSGEKILAHPVWRGRIIETLQEAYADGGETALADAAVIYRKHVGPAALAHATLIPGAVETLKFLREQNIPLAVVSQKRQHSVEAEYGKLLAPIFGDSILLVGSTPESKGKPHPEALYKAMDGLGIPAKNRGAAVWMVGDSLHSDIGAAKNAGCAPVWFGPDAAKARAEGTAEVPCVIDHAELKQVGEAACWDKEQQAEFAKVLVEYVGKGQQAAERCTKIGMSLAQVRDMGRGNHLPDLEKAKRISHALGYENPYSLLAFSRREVQVLDAGKPLWAQNPGIEKRGTWLAK